MKRDKVTCPRCGKSLTPEEIEIGKSLECPHCRPKQRQPGKKPRGRKQTPMQT
jgi:DNA-directed RNA polymerase subunit RPC12/RpoP